jgi:aspartyl-tRNA(Asn)/glutamyl-tRNA(Gln) amidotransferase subunit B
LGTRREIKNLNSFKFMQQAIDFEVLWQIEQIEDGKTIQQATVLFDPDSGETRAMRTKEDAADYRYFPDPDLPPLCISEQWIEDIKGQMTELPRVMAARFVADHGLPEYDATTLTQSKAVAAYFEETVRVCKNAKLASNWIMGEVSRRLNADGLDIAHAPLKPAHIGTLILRISDGTVSNNAARTVFDGLWDERSAELSRGVDKTTAKASESAQIDALIERLGLKQMNDSSALEAIIDQVIATNPDNVAQFKAGKDKAFNALVGQIMKASQGKANPQQAGTLLRQKLV